MTTRLLTIALPAILLALPAGAQTTKGAQAGSLDTEFKQSDTNHDGYLSRAEITARMAKMRVGGQAIDAVHAQRLAGLFIARADTNKDGRVSEAESRALLTTVFSAYDLNHDGRIDPQEAERARAAARAESAKPTATPSTKPDAAKSR